MGQHTHMLLLTLALGSSLVGLPPLDLPPHDSTWECPGFPCFIVNAFEYRKYKSLSQTCGPVDTLDVCSALQLGKSFTTGNYTHHVSSRHPCSDYWGCMQTTCTQGSSANCTAMCDKLNLLPIYQAPCRDFCSSSR